MARKTKAEAEATREAILDAAEFEFVERGVARTSLEQIACAAGVTRGAIYWHFRNKNDLYSAMLSRVSSPMEGQLDDLLGRKGSIEELHDICAHGLRQLAEDEHHFRVFSILLHRNESDIGMALLRELVCRSHVQITHFFESDAGQAFLHPELTPSLAAKALQSFFTGIYYEYLGDPTRWDLKKEAPALVNLAFRGLAR